MGVFWQMDNGWTLDGQMGGLTDGQMDRQTDRQIVHNTIFSFGIANLQYELRNLTVCDLNMVNWNMKEKNCHIAIEKHLNPYSKG